MKPAQSDLDSTGSARRKVPPQSKRAELLLGPYHPPDVDVGTEITCHLRGKGRVCGWGTGKIRWPLIRVGHGGKGAYAMTAELARAVRNESESAICYWFGVGTATVAIWRRKLGVPQFNDGTRRLYSLWKEPKLPTLSLTISKPALRRFRLASGLSNQQVATAMGWNSVNSYGQLESGKRQATTAPTLNKLAQALACDAKELLKTRSRGAK